jgi:hypothetical protein
MRLAMFETLMNLCGQLPPEITIQILDLVVELSDVPGKEEIVKRIRKITGQMDPDMANTPEAMAQVEAQQQAEQEQAAIQQQATMAALAEQEAKVKKLLADVVLILEKARTEAVNREAAAHQVVMDERQFHADERDRRHTRNLNTFQALNAAAKDEKEKKTGKRA